MNDDDFFEVTDSGVNSGRFAVRAEMVGDVGAMLFELVAVGRKFALEQFDGAGKRPVCFGDLASEPSSQRFGEQVVVEASQPFDFADCDSESDDRGDERDDGGQVGDDLGDRRNLIHRCGSYIQVAKFGSLSGNFLNWLSARLAATWS